jgi:hypothetical protein
MDYILALEYLDTVLNLELTFYTVMITIYSVKGVSNLWKIFTK